MLGSLLIVKTEVEEACLAYLCHLCFESAKLLPAVLEFNCNSPNWYYETNCVIPRQHR